MNIWVNSDTGWRPLLLNGAIFQLVGNPPYLWRIDDPRAPPQDSALLQSLTSERDLSWALLVPTGIDVWLNGTPVHSGIRILNHRDAIRLEETVYFSTECLATPQQFPGAPQPLYCPRCKQELKTDQIAVKCPQCGIWHHQDQAAQRPCWTYAEHCALCDQPTDLEAGYRWSPEAL